MARPTGLALSFLLVAGVIAGCTSAGASPAAAQTTAAVATAGPTAAGPTTAATAAPTVAPTAAPTAPPTAAPTVAATAAGSPAATAASDGYGGYGGGYGGSTTASSPSAAAGSPATGGAFAIVAIGNLGKVLVGPGGLTLYTFKPDSPGVSTCNGGCADAWPPFSLATAPAAPGGATGKVTIITRADGTKQVAYNGAPLYTFSGDSKAGEANGQGSGGSWFVAAP